MQRKEQPKDDTDRSFHSISPVKISSGSITQFVFAKKLKSLPDCMEEKSKVANSYFSC